MNLTGPHLHGLRRDRERTVVQDPLAGVAEDTSPMGWWRWRRSRTSAGADEAELREEAEGQGDDLQSGGCVQVPRGPQGAAEPVRAKWKPGFYEECQLKSSLIEGPGPRGFSTPAPFHVHFEEGERSVSENPEGSRSFRSSSPLASCWPPWWWTWRSRSFFRYVIQNPPTWTEELARFLFAWQIFLGGGAGLRARKPHRRRCPAHGAAEQGTAASGDGHGRHRVLGFLAVLVWLGIRMVQLTSDTYSTAMHLNMGVVYASLPFGAAISAMYVVIHLVNAVRGKAVQTAAPSCWWTNHADDHRYCPDLPLCHRGADLHLHGPGRVHRPSARAAIFRSR